MLSVLDRTVWKTGLLVLGMLAFLVVGSAEAADDPQAPADPFASYGPDDFVWTGASSAAAKIWNDAANWHRNAVPEAGDTAIFTAISSANCVIDSNLTVGAIHILDDYEGIVSFGSATLTLTKGNLRLSQMNDGHFLAGTSVIRFASTEGKQALIFRDRYPLATVENANTGGELQFLQHNGQGGWNTVIGTFRGLAGSTTRFGWMTNHIEHFELVGTDTAPASLVHGILFITGSQRVAYARLGSVNASNYTESMPLDATDHCTDLGKNQGVYFNRFSVWTGAGENALWSNPANWTGGTIPEADAIACFASGAKDCQLDTDIQLSELLVYSSYTGSISGMGGAITVTGARFLITSDAVGRFKPGNSTVLFSPVNATAVAPMRVMIPDGQNFDHLKVTSGSAVRFLNGFSAQRFTVEPGASLDFAGTDIENPNSSAKRVVVGSIDWQGTASSPIKMKPVLDFRDQGYNYIYLYGKWFLEVSDSQTVSHVHVLGCDATAGQEIAGLNGCIDRSGNSGWAFSDYASIRLPAASPVSPLCVEGWRQGSASTSVQVTSNGAATSATFVGGNRWYVNVPLNAAGPSSLAVLAGSAPVTTAEVVWTPTDLQGRVAASSRQIMRPNDSLLFTIAPPEEGQQPEGSTVLTADPEGASSLINVSGRSAASDVLTLRTGMKVRLSISLPEPATPVEGEEAQIPVVELDAGLGEGFKTYITPVLAEYAVAGTFMAKARINGEEVGTLAVKVRSVMLDDGQGGVPVALEGSVPVLYVNTGQFKVRALIDGVEAASHLVKVVDVDLNPDDPLAAQVGVVRSTQINVLGGVASDVTFTSANPDHLEITNHTVNNKTYVDFRIKPELRGDIFLVARAGGPEGQILRTQQLHAFSLETTTYEYHPVLKNYADGDTLIGGCIRMIPCYRNLKINMHIATAGSLFEENGSTDLWLRTRDFDHNGQMNYYIVTSSSRVACHGSGVALDDE